MIKEFFQKQQQKATEVAERFLEKARANRMQLIDLTKEETESFEVIIEATKDTKSILETAKVANRVIKAKTKKYASITYLIIQFVYNTIKAYVLGLPQVNRYLLYAVVILACDVRLLAIYVLCKVLKNNVEVASV